MLNLDAETGSVSGFDQVLKNWIRNNLISNTGCGSNQTPGSGSEGAPSYKHSGAVNRLLELWNALERYIAAGDV